MKDSAFSSKEASRLLERFDSAAEALITRLGEDLDSRPPPEILYHYTDDGGLKGILESGTLWLNDVFTLNDPSELLHGFNNAIEILKRKTKSSGRNAQAFVDTFAAALNRRGISQTSQFLSCSFSRSGNDLGQWRSYGDDGRGFALGFIGYELDHAFTTDEMRNSSFPVLYDDARLRTIQAQIADLAMPLLAALDDRSLAGEALAKHMAHLSVLLAAHFIRTSLFFKNEAYKNEEEFRFLQLFGDPQSFPEFLYRSRPYTLVKYRAFDWRKAAPTTLRHIIVGPAADRTKAEQFAFDCLAAFSRSAVPVSVTFSEIPYRSNRP